MENMKFEPFYNDGEADKFRYYSVPQILFTDDKFIGISALSKLLYGFLLDRTGLSRRNHWCDKDGRLYVHFPLIETMEKLNISKPSCVKLFKELEEIGLIEQKRQGQGMPTKIYVNNFSRLQKLESMIVENSVESVLKPVESEFRSQKNLLLEVKKFDFSTLYNQPNNQPDLSILLSTCEDGEKERRKEEPKSVERQAEKEETTYEQALERIRTQVEADKLSDGGAELVELMAWAETCHQKTIAIHGTSVSAETVRERFRNLRREHLQYVLDNVRSNGNIIRCRRNYLLFCLYDAPLIRPETTEQVGHSRDAPVVSVSKQPLHECEHADDYRSFIYNIDE
ncbi:MAG: replication initiator protein A [Ruminococcus sp.]|nr:replication initiator protein A [Ruminococcus sp.]